MQLIPYMVVPWGAGPAEKQRRIVGDVDCALQLSGNVT
jgi:hypothetical protein